MIEAIKIPKHFNAFTMIYPWEVNRMPDADATPHDHWPINPNADVNEIPPSPHPDLPTIRPPFTPITLTINDSAPFNDGVVILNELNPVPPHGNQEHAFDEDNNPFENFLCGKRNRPETLADIKDDAGWPCGRIILWH